MNRLLDQLFGCSHPRYSWPITWRKTRRTTVSCLTCGRELNYSWERMEIVTPREQKRLRAMQVRASV